MASNGELPGRPALAVMGGLIAVGPLALYLIALVRGQFADSGPVIPGVLFALLAVILAVIYLPPTIAVISSEPIRARDVAVFAASLLSSHVAAFAVGSTPASGLGLLAYPIGSAVATIVIRSLGSSEGVQPAP